MKSSMPNFDLETFLPYQLSVLAGKISQDFSTIYAKRFDLSIPEWRVLAHLQHAGDVSVREIHQRVAMDKPKVSRAAQRLELRGLVRKKENKIDRRLVSLSLTSKGQKMMDEIIPLAIGFGSDLRHRLSDDDQRALDRIIGTFLE